jgi:hypothetical protein
MSHTYYMKMAAARRADCSPAMMDKLRGLGLLNPIRASDGTCLYSERDIEFARARVQAWRDRPKRPKKAAKTEARPSSSTGSDDGGLRPILASRKGI